MYDLITHQYQSYFAKYCRTGEYQEIPGVNKKHIKQYRRLVYNVIDDTLRTAYPLTKKLLSDTEWDDLVHYFFSKGKCSSPQIWRMPKEFFVFWEERNHPILEKYPFILELLHFEWLEIEIYMMEDVELESYKKEGDLSKDKLVLNPELQILALQYPVHTKNSKNITKADAGQYFVSIHRHQENGKVIFTEINYVHLVLLDSLMQAPANVSELKALWSQSMNEEVIEVALLPFIENSLTTNLILGFI